MQRPFPKYKVFAVGDIHGCCRKLANLMERLPLDTATDFLIFLGDYIDRGPESREVIDYLLEIGRKVPNAVFLLGNHEYALLEYSRTGNLDYLRMLRSIGVEETLSSYSNSPVCSLGDLSFLPGEHIRFLESLRPYFRLDGYLFVHAGTIPGEDIEHCSLDRLLTVRERFLQDETASDEIVVFGHTPFETPFVTRNKIGIDTGAADGNLLTAVELPRMRFYHA
ncbi:MAG: metallophosphoesterase [Syntrophobacteraceae bacterium]